VPGGQQGERQQRNDQKPCRDAELKDQPGADRDRADGAESGVCEASVEAGQARMFVGARGPPLAIFVEWGNGQIADARVCDVT